jgi:hypothetical protein
MSGKERKRRPRGQAAEPITVQSLRKLFETHVLRGDLKLPGDAELNELTGILEYWRQVYLNEQILRHRRKLQDAALGLVKTLNDIVSKLIELDQQNLIAAATDRAPAGVLRELTTRLTESGDTRATVERVRRSPGLLHSPLGYGAEGWKWLADVLPLDFVNAMKSANPEFAPGVSHTGPVARFLAAVVPMLTGEHPPAASIATQLKMRRKAHREASLS